MKFLFATFLLYIVVDVSTAARILGVFPHVGKSHYIMFEPMMKALAANGHDVTVITHYPLKDSPLNFKNIDLTGTFDKTYMDGISIDRTPGESLNVLCTFRLSQMGTDTCEKVLSSKPIQDLLNSNQTFDLVFYEIFDADCFLGFIYKFKAFSVALSSSSFMPWASARFGLPDNPSYIANQFTSFSDEMNFSGRLSNTIHYFLSTVGFSLLADSQNYIIAKKYFGEDLPPLSDIARNTSLFFVNTHFSINQVRPYSPNVIEVAGVHIEPPGKLSKELKDFLDEAKEGVVYFSLGSTARGATLPAEKRDAFLEAFRSLPQKVLWKWEDENLPNKPSNVMISKWVPQTAVLAHPNIKLFITHGGLMGTLEAVHYGVPMISMPLFGDQFHNVAMVVKRGIGIKLSANLISFETVQSALNTILTNSSFRERAKQLSQVFNDRPLKPLDAVLYWTEYVLRHKGASQLQSFAAQLPLYQYLLLDVIAVFISGFLFIMIIAVYCISYLCCKKRIELKKSRRPKEKRK